MMKRFALVMALVVACAAPAAANLLQNGSFETNTLDNWNSGVFYYPGWGTAAPPAKTSTGYATFTGTGIPFDGQYMFGTDYSGHGNFHIGIWQSFDTIPGMAYSVTGGYMGGRQNANDTMWWEVDIKDGETSNPDDPGVVIAKQEAGPGVGMSFREAFAGTFVATGNRTTFMYKVGRVESADYVIEAYGLDAVDITAVPEPSSILALASGLIGMAGFVIRRRS